jgi:hypothetical protein
MESQLADGHGCVCFKGGFGSVSGWGVQVEKVLCGILWRGDGRGGVFYHFFHFVKTDHLSITPYHSPSVHDRAVETFVSRGEKGSGRLPYPSDTTISVGWKDGLAWLSPRAESERAHDLQGR